MHIPAVHAEKDLRVLRRLIHENPLGMFTTGIHSEKYPFLQTSHIPFILDVADPSSTTEMGRLRGHLARANPHAKAAIDSLSTGSTHPGSTLEHEVLVVFNCRDNHYITPGFYTKTKPQTGKVVPTWNYTAVQVYGKARFYLDPNSEETDRFLSKQIRDLSHHGEANVMGYTGEPGKKVEWKVEDAPPNYINILKKAIIGVDIEIERLEGKFKMSQEMDEGDREGVIKGLAELKSEVAQGVSEIVQERHEMKKAQKSAKATA